METNKDIEIRNEEFQKGRGWAMGVAAVVYVGVVIAATVLFISFILTAFPSNAYLSRAVMAFAGLLVGGSMIAFPLALHNWAVEKTHRRVTTALYYIEMGIIAINSLVAFTALLTKYAGLQNAPEWVLLYEPFSIMSIIYTLLAWGTVFLLDPGHKRKSKDQENWQRFQDKIADKMAEFLDSEQGEDVVMDIAERRAYEEFNANRFKTEKKPWGSGRRKVLPESTTTALPQPAQIDPAILARVVRQLKEDYPDEYKFVPDDILERMVSREVAGNNGVKPDFTRHQ